MRFRDQRNRSESSTHEGLVFNPQLSRRENKWCRQHGINPCEQTKKSLEKIKKERAA